MNKTNLFEQYALKTGTVYVPNWGDKEWDIKELTAAAMDKMRVCKGGELEMATIAIIHGVIDEDGKRVFADSDKKKLLDMSAADLVLVSAAIVDLSDLGVSEEK